VTDTSASAAEPLRFRGQYTTEPDYVSRFVRTYFAYRFSRPFTIVVWAVLASSCAILFAVAILGHGRDGSFLTPSLFLAFVIGIYVLSYWSSLRQVGRQVPVGSVFGIGFRSNTMVIQGPQVTSEVQYSAYRSCLRRGRFVILTRRGSRMTSLLPAELFTDEAFELLRSKVEDPNRKP
jgi:hypothetical protein